MTGLKNYLLNASYTDLESQVRDGNYLRINDRVWSMMVESGITERWGDNWANYRYIFLKIPYSDTKALMNKELPVIQQYEGFGVYVSALFHKHDVIVDPDEGKVIVIQCL